MYNSVTVSTFALSYNRHRHPSPELFHVPVKHELHIPLPQLLVALILLPVSVSSTILSASHNWNHIVFVLL